MVLGCGGFASGPGGIAAWLAGAPLVIHEQNAIPGLANRALGGMASAVAVSFSPPGGTVRVTAGRDPGRDPGPHARTATRTCRGEASGKTWTGSWKFAVAFGSIAKGR